MTFFFQRRNKLRPLDFIFSSNTTSEASIEIASLVLASQHQKNEKTVDTSNTYNDLEIFKSVSGDTPKFIQKYR